MPRGRRRLDKDGGAPCGVRDHRLRARHQAAQPGALPLGQRRPAPRGAPGAIARGERAGLVRHQRRRQRRGRSDACAWPSNLPQRCAVRALAQQRLERRRMGRPGGEGLDAQQGRNKAGPTAATYRLGALRPQSPGVCWLGALMGRKRLREAGSHRLKGLLLGAPMGQKRPTHTRQMRRDGDQRPARGGAACRVARASLGPMTLPWRAQPMQMAPAHRHRSLQVGDLVEQDPGRALL
jgi:hypothetical protein